MAITLAEIETTLLSAGMERRHETKKKVLFVYPDTNEVVYLNRDSARRSPGLVIHPRHDPARRALSSIGGVTCEDQFYHSSNMRRFPMRRNNGSADIPYGIPFAFESTPSLRAFLERLLDLESNAFDDIAVAAEDLNAVSPTERDAIVKSRIGQGPFRLALESYWKKCAVNGCSVMAALRASHIKPWRTCSNTERLDPYNGLLLTANIDALFDRGLLSFLDDGTVIISSKLAPAEATLLGIGKTSRLRTVDPRHLPYLTFHRTRVFCA